MNLSIPARARSAQPDARVRESKWEHGGVDFDFNDDQRALRDAVRDALSGLVPTDVLQSMTAAGGRMPEEIWSRIADLGWPALMIEEQYGATELLDDLASGAKRGTVAVDELAVAGDPLASIATVASGSGEVVTLTGVKPVVPDGATADWVIVVARDDAGLGAYLVEGATASAVPGLDPTRELARLELSSTAARRLGPDGDQTALLARIVDDAAVMLCAELVGGSEASFELATEYSKQRVQFGRPIGTFQAVKHLAADMLRDLTLARVGTHYAAWASDTDAPDREVAAAMAKSWVAEAAIAVTSTSIQVHGAVGFTWECPAHYYYKRAKATDLVLGRQGWQRARVADLLLGPPTAATA